MYKAICFDLDGTLLNSNKKISDKAVSLINELASKNIKIIIATGRNYDFSLLLTNNLTSKRVIISNNGSLVADANKNKIFVNYINEDFIVKLDSFLNSYKRVKKHIYPDPIATKYDLLVANEENIDYLIGLTVRNQKRIKIMDQNDFKDKILSIALHGIKKDITSLSKSLDPYNNQISYHVMNDFYQDSYMLEVMPNNINKLTAIKKYLYKLNISLSETIAFGDNINDYEMLKNVGLGIAMKNSSKELTRITKNISSYTNDEDGVYKELLKIYKRV